MRRFYGLLIVTGLTVYGFAQQAGQSPSVTPTLRTGAKLVVVDVTVTDANHRPVRDLKADDFTLLENNTAQNLKNFEEHRPPTAEQLLRVLAAPPIVPGVFTNLDPGLAVAAGGPMNILLIDRLNTPAPAQAQLRQQLLNYLAQAKPGSRTAIFGLSTQLVLLQGFTGDPRLLHNAIEKKTNQLASPLMDPSVASGGNAARLSDEINQVGTGDAEDSMGGQLKFLRDMNRVSESMDAAHQLMDRSRRTLDAMDSLARFLVNIPGRKNVIWFSGSFPLDIAPDAKLAEELTNHVGGLPFNPAFLNVDDVNAEYRETISLLSRAQVVMYPVDARGVTVLPTTTVTGDGGSGSQYIRDSTVGPASAKSVGPDRLASDLDSALESEFTANSTMRDIAFKTGGRAFLDGNNLTKALEEAISDGSSYYTLAYAPGNGDWKGDYRKIEVRMRQKGYLLNYRRGYYADDPFAPISKRDKLESGRAVTASLAVPDFGAMHLALLHAGPQPADLLLRATVAPTGTADENSVAPNNATRKDLKGPYRRYAVDLSTDAHLLDFTTSADGLHHASVEFVTLVYDQDGNAVIATQNTAQANLRPAVYDEILAKGLPVHQEVSVPAKGIYYLRIAAHDLNSGRVGAVELPVDAVRKLSPAKPRMMEAETKPAAPAVSGASAPAPAAAVVADLPMPGPPKVPTAAAPTVPTAVTPSAASSASPSDAALDGILAKVRVNFDTYVAAIPNVYALEHVDSRMASHPQDPSEAMSHSAATDSTFRLTRIEESNHPLRLTEEREVRAIDKKPVPADRQLAGPVVVQGAFGYGFSFLSPELKQCYDYRLLSPQKLHGASVLVVEYTSKASPSSDFVCPVVEQNSGRAYLDPESMQVVRLEQKRPRHVLDGGIYNDLGGIGAGNVGASQVTGGSTDMIGAMNASATAGSAVRIPPGTLGVWNWAIDYAPVTLDGKKFWLPKSIHSTTATIGSVTLVQWTFAADYGDYHLMTAHSTILPSAQK